MLITSASPIGREDPRNDSIHREHVQRRLQTRKGQQSNKSHARKQQFMKGLQHHPVFTTVTAASLSQRTVMRSPAQRAPHNSKATTMLKVPKN